MQYTVCLNIMPKAEILDPQGKATQHGLALLGFSTVSDVRVGRRVQLQLEAGSEDEARKLAQDAAKRLLANLIIEDFEIGQLEAVQG